MANHALESVAVKICARESVVSQNADNANIGIAAHKVEQHFPLIFDTVALAPVAVVFGKPEVKVGVPYFFSFSFIIAESS
jgi:hypothetical protein